MDIPFFQKLTLLDYPSKTAATVFTYGCNFRCPFCHNSALVVRQKEEMIDPDEFFHFLKGRKNLLDGVCITGGEPLMQSDLPEFISKIKELGFLVKLDTNGSFPERLDTLLGQKLVDYVAMDIKNSPDKYAFTAGLKTLDISKIQKSIDLIKEKAPDFEFRTTAVKEFHETSDFAEIGKWLCGNVKYFIQCFKDSGDILQEGLSAFDENQLTAFKQAALPYLPLTELRGI